MTDEAFNEMTSFQNMYQAYKKAATCKRGKKEVVEFELNLSHNLWELIHRMEDKTYRIGGYHKFMIYDNVACRIGKGTHFGMDRLTYFLREHYKKYGTKGYILKYDVSRFFDSIDHDVLKEQIKDIPDRNVLGLLYHIINSYSKEKNPATGEEKGLPMENQTSQGFALYYLDPLDRLIKEKMHIKHYVRYMDDGIMLHESNEYLNEVRKEMDI